MKRILLAVLAGTCLGAPAFSQGVYSGTLSAQTTLQIGNPLATVLIPLPGAIITVCNFPSNGSLPCTNKANVCPDSTLVGCSASAPNNPITADARANFGFWIATGSYDYTVCPVTGVCQGPYHLTLAPYGVAAFTSVTANPFISSTANPATAGAVRLASGDAENFRNNANSGNINGLSKGTDDVVVVGDTAGAKATQLSASKSTASVLKPDLFSANDSTLELAGNSDGTGTVIAARSGTLQTPQLAVTGTGAVTQLSTPSAPGVAPTLGAASTWTYTVVAKAGTGTTPASASGSTAVGASTLDATHFNTITWAAVAGAASYDIYRTATGASPSTTGKIGNVVPSAGLSLVDNGLTGDGVTAPSTNTTGTMTAFQYLSTGPSTIDGTEAAAPAAPAVGHWVLYPKTSVGWCWQNSSGTENCPAGSLSATSAAFAPGALTLGQCATQANTAVTGATTAMVAILQPVSDPGTGFTWQGIITSGNVAVRVCNVTSGTLTPSSTAYNIRVIK